MDSRIVKQIEFIMEIDKLKSINRRAVLVDRSRQENDAEHSWHLAVMACILLEHGNDNQIDLLRVIKMLLIHDIVEIDAGDVSAYDVTGQNEKYEKEHTAARRIFEILPDDQHQELYELWMEFEEGKTAEARFAKALDRLSPLFLNYYTEGYTWKKYGITPEMVISRNMQIREGSQVLWDYAQVLIDTAVKNGFL